MSWVPRIRQIITVYNKIDKLPPDSGLAERLSRKKTASAFPAKARYNLDGLLALIAENLKLKAVDGELPRALQRFRCGRTLA